MSNQLNNYGAAINNYFHHFRRNTQTVRDRRVKQFTTEVKKLYKEIFDTEMDVNLAADPKKLRNFSSPLSRV